MASEPMNENTQFKQVGAHRKAHDSRRMMGRKHDASLAMSEDQASGVVAEVFADIRQRTGSPFVTSVWRVLAADEERLISVWKAARPFVRPHEIACVLRGINDVDPDAFVLGEAIAGTVIRAYTLTNGTVMAALMATLGPTNVAPSQGPEEAPLQSDHISDLQPAPALPLLQDRSSLDPRLLPALDRLDGLGAEAGSPLLHATIWRHLASAAPQATAALAASFSPSEGHAVRLLAERVHAELSAKANALSRGAVTFPVPDSVRHYIDHYVNDPHVTPRVIAAGLMAGAKLSPPISWF